MGGAISRVGEDETAYSNRGALFDFISAFYWEDPAEDPERVAAMRRIWSEVDSFGGAGVYPNNLGDEADQGARQAYGHAKLERLADIKRRFDPDNVFRHTSTIRHV
jgi:FAD/FMN-containing dehydrogenase